VLRGGAFNNNENAGRGGKLKVAPVENVELLGFDGKLTFAHTGEGLRITGLPDKRPVQCAHCFKITTR
jgi:hypothetical protein